MVARFLINNSMNMSKKICKKKLNCFFFAFFSFCVITSVPIKIQTRSAPLKDCLNLSFVKDEHIVGEKMARNVKDKRKIGNNDFTICDQVHKDNDILSVHLHTRGSCIRVRSRFNLKCNFVHCSKMDPNLFLTSCQNCAISNINFLCQKSNESQKIVSYFLFVCFIKYFMVKRSIIH